MERQVEVYTNALDGYRKALAENDCPHARASHSHLAGECILRIGRAKDRLARLDELARLGAT